MPHYNDWLQVTQPFTSGEDEHSLYELQHPPNPIMTQHVIKTIVALNTPQYSVQDNDSEVELPRQSAQVDELAQLENIAEINPNEPDNNADPADVDIADISDKHMEQNDLSAKLLHVSLVDIYNLTRNR
ncbi:hypothetical protein MUCCIDRAFT_113695 [Mucor lusitanicus CBS 277.49]|uniref:Uncharacterized protein n=1 Tax=Mucor lusitanicus CBS 277.49 TaxID=747725 RepID=A0A168IQL4_MUCCL|nr:hypothetical protein MUCCIDRAFT_113695 [Mucor lusitanicus CBS 277.49]